MRLSKKRSGTYRRFSRGSYRPRKKLRFLNRLHLGKRSRRRRFR